MDFILKPHTMATSSTLNDQSIMDGSQITWNFTLTDSQEVLVGDMNINELGRELRETYRKIAINETRKILLESLVKEELATRDVYSFLKNQAQLRIFNKCLDKNISRLAMKAKISDIRTSLRGLDSKRKSIERCLRERLERKRHKVRRFIKPLREEALKVKKIQIAKYMKKINHYKAVQANKIDTKNEQGPIVRG